MIIKHDDSVHKGRFFYELEGKKMAQMTYSHAGSDKIIIEHTEVDPSLKGQGIGYKLVEAAVKFARENQIKILPLCPFVAAVFKKKSEYNDVVF